MNITTLHFQKYRDNQDLDYYNVVIPTDHNNNLFEYIVTC